MLAGLLVALAAQWPWKSVLQSAWFDAYQRLAPRAIESMPATVVEIDEKSLAALGQWPWPRTLLAELVTAIGRANPAAIGLDILLPEADPLSLDRRSGIRGRDARQGVDGQGPLTSNDAELARAIAGAPVVLAIAGTPGVSRWPLRTPPVVVRSRDSNPSAAAPSMPALTAYHGALTSLPGLGEAASGWGLVSADPADGVIRRVPLVADVNGTITPSLAMEMWRVALGSAKTELLMSGSSLTGVAVDALLVPAEADGTARVYFSRRDARRSVSAIDVLEKRVEPDRLRQKLVLIGVTALALGDYPYTPAGERMPGTEIHAQLLENIYEGTLLSRPSWTLALELGATLLLGALLVWATPRWSVRDTLMLAVASIVLPLALAYWAFRADRVLIDAATPAASLLLLFVALLALTLADAARQRRTLQHALQLEREQAARVAGEMEAARRIQLATLPRPETLQDERVDLAAVMEPAREVGGDLYDFFPLDTTRLFLMVGDVAGKGLPASMFMAVSKALCKSTLLRAVDSDIGALMRVVNAEISRDNPEMLYVTAFAAILDLDSGAFAYCNAGHENPHLIRATPPESVRIVDGGGPPICAVDGFAYPCARLQMHPGEIVCIVSDGVPEARNASGGFYGQERLDRVLSELAGTSCSPDRAVQAIRADVHAFAGGAEPADDLTVLALRWNGPRRALSS